MSHESTTPSRVLFIGSRSAILSLLTFTIAGAAVPAKAQQVQVGGHVAPRCWVSGVSVDMSGALERSAFDPRTAARCSQSNLPLTVRTREIAVSRTAPLRDADSQSKAASHQPSEPSEEHVADRTAFEIIASPTL